MLIEYLLNALNLALMAGALSVQLPQIIKIVKARSVTGISETASTLQVFSTGSYVAYNYIKKFPFATWGDSFFAETQYLIVLLMIWAYNPSVNSSQRLIVSSIILLSLTALYCETVPSFLVPIIGMLPFPMIISARLPQILLNYKQKHTGQLSFLSLAMQVAGNSARVFSTLLSVSDWTILASHLMAMTFNGIPLLQILYYKSNTDLLLAKEAAPSAKKSSAAMSTGRRLPVAPKRKRIDLI